MVNGEQKEAGGSLMKCLQLESSPSVLVGRAGVGLGKFRKKSSDKRILKWCI